MSVPLSLGILDQLEFDDRVVPNASIHDILTRKFDVIILQGSGKFGSV
jgi:hypothetical protein